MEDKTYEGKGNYQCSCCKEIKYLKPQRSRYWSSKVSNYVYQYRFRCNDCNRESVRKWRQKNPLKCKAHRAVFISLRNGFIKKEPCQICGKTKVQAHHVDYELPLDVIWYCKEHHGVADRLAHLQGFI